MCLIAFAWKTHPQLPLALIANRDELHARPTAPAGFDPEHPHVCGGRDLQAGGGWLMVSRAGRLAAVTNVRCGRQAEDKPRSRGALVRDFVAGTMPVSDFIQALSAQAGDYGRFNLLLRDGDELHFASNHPQFSTHAVVPGIHAMSNGAFDAAWPKATHAADALRGWMEVHASDARSEAELEPLFEALADTRRAPDALLPETGVGIDLERRLSPPFILDPVYGTRCSSVVLIDAEDSVRFIERRFAADGQRTGESVERL